MIFGPGINNRIGAPGMIFGHPGAGDRALHVSLDENNCLVIDNDPLITVSVSLDEDNCLIVEGAT